MNPQALPTPHSAFRRLALTTAAGLAAVTLAACGTSSGLGHQGGTESTPVMSSMAGMGPTTGPTTGSTMGSEMGSGSPSAGATGRAAGPHDAADIAFLVQMIPHHMQAVVMANLVATRSATPQVATLAAQIRAAQTSEIAEMSGWLRGWGVAMGAGSGMGGAMSGSGMMSTADMAHLATLRGVAFDRAWLTMMTSHHEGALTMARVELGAGTNADARTLAKSIITSQTAQITRMKTLLGGLPTS